MRWSQRNKLYAQEALLMDANTNRNKEPLPTQLNEQEYLAISLFRRLDSPQKKSVLKEFEEMTRK